MVKNSNKSFSSISSFSLDDSISTYGGRRRYDSRDLVSKDSKEGGSMVWIDIVSIVLNVFSLFGVLYLAYTAYNQGDEKKEEKDEKEEKKKK